MHHAVGEIEELECRSAYDAGVRVMVFESRMDVQRTMAGIDGGNGRRKAPMHAFPSQTE